MFDDHERIIIILGWTRCIEMVPATGEPGECESKNQKYDFWSFNNHNALLGRVTHRAGTMEAVLLIDPT